VEQARQRFQKAIDLRPDYVLARLALAQLQVTAGTSTPPSKARSSALDRSQYNSARLIESAALMARRNFWTRANCWTPC